VQAVAAGLQAWRLIAAERAVTSALRLAAFIALVALDELTVARAVAVLACTPALGALVYVPLLSRAPDGAAPLEGTRDLLSYGARVWAGSLAGIALSRLDQTLMTPLAGTVELGLYAVAVSLSELPLIVNTAVREVFFSADAATRDLSALARATRLSTAATTIVAAVIAASAWCWIGPLFGARFEAALPTLLVLLLAVVVGNPGSLAGVGLGARGRPRLRSASLAVAAVVNVLVVTTMVPLVGAPGAAAATLAGNVVAATGNIVLLRRVTGLPVGSLLGVRRADLVSLRRQETEVPSPE